MLSGFHDNVPALAAKLLADPAVAHRNDVALDWADAWRLEMSPAELPEAGILDVSVHFAQRIPLRLTTLIATGLALSRAEVTKHIAAGRISSDRKLTGRCAQDFSFVFTNRNPDDALTDTERPFPASARTEESSHPVRH